MLHGVTGHLVPQPQLSPCSPGPADGSPYADPLASAAAELLANPSHAAQLGSTGARNAARYTWPRVTDEILDVYRGLLPP